MCGLEVGLTETNYEKAGPFLNKVDFVLGSNHNTGKIYSNTPKMDAISAYLKALPDLIASYDFDSLAHINVLAVVPECDRYLNYKFHSAKYDRVFEALLDNDKCLEVNSKYSGLSKDSSSTMLSILFAYKMSGGRYVTLGSDSHRPSMLKGVSSYQGYLTGLGLCPVYYKNRQRILCN